MALKDDLQKIIKGEIVDDDKTLTAYSTDASIFTIRPSIVIYPKTVEDIKSLVKFVTQNPNHALSITARSAGTDMTGGAINDSIILDMTKYFNKVLEIGKESARVAPGTYYKDFENKTLSKNLIMPSYPASREICTVGGMVANNAGGERDLAYGQTQNYVRKLKVILSDGREYSFEALSSKQLNSKLKQKDFEGQIYKKVFELISENKKLIRDAKPKVLKNSTGYFLWDVWDGTTFDLTKLFTGSQGTLGIITEIEFKLIKPKSSSALLVIFLPSLGELDKIVSQVLQFKPESFECYDIETLKLAVKHFTSLGWDFKYNNLLQAYLDFVPEILANLRGNLPQLTLLANFTGETKNEAISKCKNAQNAIKSFTLKSEIKDSFSSAEKYWIIRHKSFGLLRKYSENGKASSFIDDIIVKPQYLPEFLPKLNSLIAPFKEKLVYTLAGHIGDGNFHIIPLMDLSREDVRGIIPELMEKVFELVFKYKGSMSAEHNDGLIRGPYLPKMYGDHVYQLFKAVKQIFDPQNIFNPHKKTMATFQYSLNHLIKT